MENPLLAAVLIVKDEERNLAECLDSLERLRPTLGEICVYDTGSGDRTVEIAETAGATVTRGYWDADFARARNDATAVTSAKWVLSIDADERVIADPQRLGPLLRRGLTERLTGWDVFDVTIVDIDAGARPLAHHPFPKIFRPSRATWNAPIHETLVSVRHGRPLVVADMPADILRLVHHGYADQATRHHKATRNAAVAEVGLDVAGKQADQVAKLHADRARALAVDDDRRSDASDAFAAALAVRGLADDVRLTILLDAVRFQLGSDRPSAEELASGERLLREAEALGAPRDTVAWYDAQILLDSDRPLEAMELLRSLRSVRLSPTLELDGHIAVATLMRAAIAAGRFDEALACAIELVATTGDVDRYGPGLFRLWGDQPAPLLAELLGGVGGGPHPRLAPALRRFSAAGASVAAAHAARASAASAPPSTPLRTAATSRGSAFGL